MDAGPVVDGGKTQVASQTVAIIEDDAAIRDSLRFLLRARGVEADCYASAADFLANAEIDQWGSLLIDQNMPNMTGIELVELLRSRKILTPAIMLTGGTDPLLVGRAKKAGVLTVLNKPIASDELMGWIRLAFISGGARPARNHTHEARHDRSDGSLA